MASPYPERRLAYNKFHTGTTKDAIIAVFCEGDFEKCLRKQIRDKSKAVLEKPLPDGQLLT